MKAFEHRRSLDLLFTLGIFKLCSFKSLVNWTPSILMAANKLGLSRPVLFTIKKSFFRHFCGGENGAEIIPQMASLGKNNIGSILDLAVEQDLAKELNVMAHEEIIETLQYDFERSKHIAKEMKETIDIASSSTGNCVALKFTCLVSPLWLSSFSALLAKKDRKGAWFEADYSSLSNCNTLNNDNERFVMENFDFARSYSLLADICEYAKTKGVQLMIDAEQTYFQPAIDYLALNLMLSYNRNSSLILNTYQMYLKDGFDRFCNDFGVFEGKNIYFAAKVVRGAYLKSESERAKLLGYQNPINETIEKTHAQYHKAIDWAHARTGKKWNILFASHNKNSVDYASSLFGKGNQQVSFAQLLGMNDYLTYTLAQNGFVVHKYVPFGPVAEVIPYLLRRAIENSDVLNNTSHDSFFIKSVLKERFSISKPDAETSNKAI